MRATRNRAADSEPSHGATPATVQGPLKFPRHSAGQSCRGTSSTVHTRHPRQHRTQRGPRQQAAWPRLGARVRLGVWPALAGPRGRTRTPIPGPGDARPTPAARVLIRVPPAAMPASESPRGRQASRIRAGPWDRAVAVRAAPLAQHGRSRFRPAGTPRGPGPAPPRAAAPSVALNVHDPARPGIFQTGKYSHFWAVTLSFAVHFDAPPPPPEAGGASSLTHAQAARRRLISGPETVPGRFPSWKSISWPAGCHGPASARESSPAPCPRPLWRPFRRVPLRPLVGNRDLQPARTRGSVSREMSPGVARAPLATANANEVFSSSYPLAHAHRAGIGRPSIRA